MKVEVINLNEKNLTAGIENCGENNAGEIETAKRGLRDAMRELLLLPVSDGELRDSISALGIDPAAIDNNRALAAALFRKALTGDVSSFKEIRSLIGEDGDAKSKKTPAENGNGALFEILAALKTDVPDE